MTREEKAVILSNIKWETGNARKRAGGQHVNTSSADVTLKSISLDINIDVGYYRSQFENRNLALKILEHVIDAIEENE